MTHLKSRLARAAWTLASLAASNSGWCGVTVSTALFCWGNSFERPRLVDGALVTAAWVVGADVCGQEAGAEDEGPERCVRAFAKRSAHRLSARRPLCARLVAKGLMRMHVIAASRTAFVPSYV